MPELPEVERARALIAARALGRRIAAVDDADTYVCRPHAPGEIASALTGSALTAAHRRGKTMWCETDRGPVLGLHLGMAGRIVVDGESAGDPVRSTVGTDPRVLRSTVGTDPVGLGSTVGTDPGGLGSSGGTDPGVLWERFALDFEDGGRLVLFDKRRLGRAVLDPDISGLGPDAAEVSAKEFRARVGRGEAPLKARIMDQSVIAGVGNLLADEALWQARLSPVRPAGGLTPEELDGLRRAIRAATRRAIRLGGVHTGEVIPHRARGAHCPRCGAEMRRATVGGRTTWWCPDEQEG